VLQVLDQEVCELAFQRAVASDEGTDQVNDACDHRGRQGCEHAATAFDPFALALAPQQFVEHERQPLVLESLAHGGILAGARPEAQRVLKLRQPRGCGLRGERLRELPEQQATVEDTVGDLGDGCGEDARQELALARLAGAVGLVSQQLPGEGHWLSEAVDEGRGRAQEEHDELSEHARLGLRPLRGRCARQVDDAEKGRGVDRQVDPLVGHEARRREPDALHEHLDRREQFQCRLGALASLSEAAHEVPLQHLQAVRDLRFLAHYQVAGQLGVLLEVRRGQELADHPVAHLLVVPGDGNEGRLDEAALDAHERGEEVELALDLVDGLLLV
jgi:hypothetical protein